MPLMACLDAHMHMSTMVPTPQRQTRLFATPTGIPPNIAVTPMLPAGTPVCGAYHNHYNFMSESLQVSHKAENKEGIVNKLQESIVDDMDFCLHSVTSNICPGWDLFFARLGDSTFMVRTDNVQDSVLHVFIVQAPSADRAMEDFCKEME
jgi:hypothetical protein